MRFESAKAATEAFEDEHAFEGRVNDEDPLVDSDVEDDEPTQSQAVKPLKDMTQVIPFCTNPLIKDIARRPFAARVIFYLEAHGASTYKEMNEALGISYGSLWNILHRLMEKGFPIVQYRKADQLNENFKYFNLRQPDPLEHVFGEQVDQEQALIEMRQLKLMLQELHRWYEYYALMTFMKHLPCYRWLTLQELDADLRLYGLLQKWGYDLTDAIALLVKNGVVYVRKDDDERITHIQRAFDNYGTRIEENMTSEDITEIKTKMDMVSIEDFFIE